MSDDGGRVFILSPRFTDAGDVALSGSKYYPVLPASIDIDYGPQLGLPGQLLPEQREKDRRT